jgi:hypothetical protein
MHQRRGNPDCRALEAGAHHHRPAGALRERDNLLIALRAKGMNPWSSPLEKKSLGLYWRLPEQ